MIVTVLKKRAGSANNGFKFQLESCLLLMRILNRINVDKDLIIDYEDFYIPEVSELISLPEAYYRWLTEKSQLMGESSEFHICNYPFVFDAAAKTKLLEVDQFIQMQLARAKAHNMVFAQLGFGLLPAVAAGNIENLELLVSRDNLLQDTVAQVRIVIVL